MSRKVKSKEQELQDYYQSCPFAKPKQQKKKLLYNGYKDKANRICHYTGQPGAERHEIWGGPWRQTSIEMGFQVDVCHRIHEELQGNSTKWAKMENIKWKMYYQKAYEQKLIDSGVSEKQARDCWMALINHNYL